MDDSIAGRRWWHGAVLYQLYVRSWFDTNDDGYGDLGGVIAKLEYLSWLGVDGVWLSPTMPSPDDDWGYDVSDYLGVHPELGTLDDLDHLIARAHEMGMRVLLDLVPNHTSNAHPWFIDAANSRGSDHRGYYVWADAAPNGGLPNNWLDTTGSPAWAWHAASGQYYLHNFLDSQPDLDWWHPALRQEFEAIVKFWFDRGVDGFRIDVAHGLYKDAQLRDNPLLSNESRLEGRYGVRSMYNANRPETHGVYREWRKIADGYAQPRLLLGETWVGDFTRLAEFYGNDDELHLAFNFPFIFSAFTASDLAEIVGTTLERLPTSACPVWTASNHDVGRLASRWCGEDERRIRLALLVLVTLPGTLVLYYGDEIAMTDVTVPRELRRDRATLSGEGRKGNRDRARTPMPWDSTPSAGFSREHVPPWLPIGVNAAGSVADQRSDPTSVLSFTRRLLEFRRRELSGKVPPYKALTTASDLWAYQVDRFTVAANFSNRSVTYGPIREGQILLSTIPGAQYKDSLSTLGPWEGLVIQSPATTSSDWT